ncbi:MAG TPA: penicillin-binding protein 2 [Microbacteriaceae bacterium]|nr:penicillin-binding protein 2 [Microbacteriaceae bacterium]
MIQRSRLRVAAFVGLLALFAVIFVLRLVDVQMVRASDINAEAASRRSNETTLFGTRGSIVDRNGSVLASSVMKYDITISPKNARDFERTAADGSTTTVTRSQAAEELGRVLGMTGAQVLGVIDSALSEDPKSDFAYLAKEVDSATYERIQELGIPWQWAKRHPSRIYPNGAVAGNLVGYMGSDGAPLAGLEYMENECLAATDGVESSLVSGDASGVVIPGSTTVEKPAVDGGQVKLTLDANLQWFAQSVAAAQVRATGARWATVVVQEVKTGRLLAVVDVPTVDPNDVDASHPDDRGSRAFSAPYEPGSTFKSLTAATVLDAGKATVADQVVAPYRLLRDNVDVNDSSRHGDEQLTLAGVLVESSNTGMSQFGERLTPEQRYSYISKFGVGSESEVGFLGESAGILNDWRGWDAQTSYTTMFGQGLATTAIQMASVYQTLGNHGVRLPVRLIESCTTHDGKVIVPKEPAGSRVVSAAAADQTMAMLEQVYNKGWLAKKWNIPGYRVATKTGTAQVPDGNGGYQKGYLVSVAGVAPADDPQYVVSVSIMDPVLLNSSAASAPVFQQVMSEVLKQNRVIPSGSIAPDLATTW